MPVAIPDSELPLHVALSAKIAEESGIEQADLDKLRRANRIGTAWSVGEAPPEFTQCRDTHVVDSIFVGSAGDQEDDHVHGDARVYMRPVMLSARMPRPDGKQVRVPFMCVVTNRQPGVEPRTDIFTDEDQFVEEVATEYRALLLGGDDEDQTAECPDPECGSEVPAGAKFCPDCGKSARRCSKCQQVVPVGDDYCSSCGCPLGKTRTCPGCDAVVAAAHKFCEECGMPALMLK
jgi:double zinc ribbon protein